MSFSHVSSGTYLNNTFLQNAPRILEQCELHVDDLESSSFLDQNDKDKCCQTNRGIECRKRFAGFFCVDLFVCVCVCVLNICFAGGMFYECLRIYCSSLIVVLSMLVIYIRGGPLTLFRSLSLYLGAMV